MHVFLILLALFLLWAFKRHRRLTLLRRYGIPGPVPSFLTGNDSELREANVPKINEWIRQYGKVFGMWDFSLISPVVVVADPELLSRIQVRDFELFPMKRMVVERGGMDANPDYEVSIVSTDITAKRWKEQRSLISTGFTSSKLRASIPLVNDAIDELLENIQSCEKDPDFDIYDFFQRFTMDTIGTSAFGIQLDVQKNPQHPLFIATKGFFEDYTKDLMQLPLYLNFTFPEFFPLIYPIRRIQRHLSLLFGCPSHWTYQTEICRRIVSQRKANATDPLVRNPDDLLQRMIEASLTSEEMESIDKSNLAAKDCADEGDQWVGKTGQRSKGKIHRMDDKEIVANASILFDAGYETTSTLLAYLVHVLVHKLDVQERIRDDVKKLISTHGTLDYNVMSELPFLDSVIYETLRLYPPITNAVTRQSTVEYEYKGYRIPPNTSILVPVHFVHRDPDVWENAEMFDPMRFYGGNKCRASSPSFQAFGFGPRNCVGLRFALMEAKLVIAHILRKYQLIPGPRTEGFEDLQITYKPINGVPKNGIFVKVIPVEE